MPLIKQKWIDRSDLQNNPDVLYVFGDNMAHMGYGGQAKEMRGEPNAIGIPTKWEPLWQDEAFFSDDDFDTAVESMQRHFSLLAEKLKNGGTVVIPTDGLGTGLSKLPEKAPRIAAYLDDQLKLLGDLDDPCGVYGYGL